MIGLQRIAEPTEKNIKKLIDDYILRFGKPPQILMVNPTSVPAELPEGINLIVKVKKFVMPNVLWMGDE